MKRVFHFSGGRTSGYMVMHYWQPGDIAIFCDTGREDKRTYKFVNDFEFHTGIKIIKLKGDFVNDVIVKEQMIPNRFKRKCTLNLKIKKARRYLRSIGWFRYTQFIGFRADEKIRVDEYPNYWEAVTTEFPLYDNGITKPMVKDFWKPVSWDLTTPPILGNCDLCFQKGKNAIMAILKDEPWRADVWMNDEENKIINPKGYTYFNGTTIRELRDLALGLKKQYNLFDIEPQFNCACTA